MRLDYIKQRVEIATGIEHLELKGRERRKVVARCMYAKLATQLTTETYKRIGEAINRDHSTILYSIQTLENHLAYEPEMKEIYKKLSMDLADEKDNPEVTKAKERLFRWLDAIPNRDYPRVLRQLSKIEI